MILEASLQSCYTSLSEHCIVSVLPPLYVPTGIVESLVVRSQCGLGRGGRPSRLVC